MNKENLRQAIKLAINEVHFCKSAEADQIIGAIESTLEELKIALVPVEVLEYYANENRYDYDNDCCPDDNNPGKHTAEVDLLTDDRGARTPAPEGVAEATAFLLDHAKERSIESPEWNDYDDIEITVSIGQLRAARSALEAYKAGRA